MSFEKESLNVLGTFNLNATINHFHKTILVESNRYSKLLKIERTKQEKLNPNTGKYVVNLVFRGLKLKIKRFMKQKLLKI